MQSVKKFEIFTDGGARNNPGPAGAGVVIKDGEGKVIKKVSKFLGEQTNNWAEYEAVHLALVELKKLVPEKDRGKISIEVKMDSELIVKQLTGKYQIKQESLFPQYIKVHNTQVKDFPKIKFTHIPREKNKEADKLVNKAIDEQFGV